MPTNPRTPVEAGSSSKDQLIARKSTGAGKQKHRATGKAGAKKKIASVIPSSSTRRDFLKMAATVAGGSLFLSEWATKMYACGGGGSGSSGGGYISGPSGSPVIICGPAEIVTSGGNTNTSYGYYEAYYTTGLKSGQRVRGEFYPGHDTTNNYYGDYYDTVNNQTLYNQPLGCCDWTPDTPAGQSYQSRLDFKVNAGEPYAGQTFTSDQITVRRP